MNTDTIHEAYMPKTCGVQAVKSWFVMLRIRVLNCEVLGLAEKLECVCVSTALESGFWLPRR